MTAASYIDLVTLIALIVLTFDGQLRLVDTADLDARRVCKSCAHGAYADVGKLNCTACPSGYKVNVGQSGCDSCPAGFYSGAGAVECFSCAEGKYGALKSLRVLK